MVAVLDAMDASNAEAYAELRAQLPPPPSAADSKHTQLLPATAQDSLAAAIVARLKALVAYADGASETDPVVMVFWKVCFAKRFHFFASRFCLLHG
jgi:hypothetical protein